MHTIESREISTGNTFPKQYWLAVHGKPKTYSITVEPI